MASSNVLILVLFLISKQVLANNDIPRLIEASHNELTLEVTFQTKNISCRKTCPEICKWEYNRPEDGNEWKYVIGVVDLDSCYSTCTIKDLLSASNYNIRVIPYCNNHENQIVNWYSNITSQIISGKTCQTTVAPVKDLRVYRSEVEPNTWLGLSWYPPKFQCLTKLQYAMNIKFATQPSTDDGFYIVGSFWTNNVTQMMDITRSWHRTSTIHTVQTCKEWPDRHCLLVVNDIYGGHLTTNQTYRIELKVMRNNMSSNVTTIKTNVTDNLKPSSPESLKAMIKRVNEMQLFWRYPLTPGGILQEAHIKVTQGNVTIYDYILNVSNDSFVYNHTIYITNLNKTTNTNCLVYVWFTTTTCIEGDVANVSIPQCYQTLSLPSSSVLQFPPLQNPSSSKMLSTTILHVIFFGLLLCITD